jgi:hypothetical protein
MPDAPTQDTFTTPSPDQVNQAVSAGPSPLSTAILGAPNPSTATTAPAPQPAQATPAPAAPSPAAHADLQHHYSLGKIASTLLGQQMDYRVDETGKTVATPIKESPGQLFRSILAGALLGGAAAKGTNSPIAGFVCGGTAGIEANQAQDTQRYNRAQQQFQNQREAARAQRERRGEAREDDRMAQEKLKTTAQIEMWNKEQIMHERDSNLRDAEFNQRVNENSVQMQRWAHEAGGMDAPIPGNNQVGNGSAMMKLYSQDPNKFAAPKGYDRFITQDHDTTGLTYDKDKGYVDQDGNPVNLEDRTTWHVSFVPQKPQPIDINGATLNRLFPKATGGIADPKQTYHMPFEQITGMATQEHEMSRRDADETYKRKHDDLRADMDELKSKANNFTRQADEAERQGDRAIANDLRQKANDAYDEYDDLKSQANPHSALRKSDSGRNDARVSLTAPEQAAVNSIIAKPGTIAVRVGTKIGPVPSADLDTFLKQNPGAQVVGRSTAQPNAQQSYRVLMPDGSTQNIGDYQIDTFLRSNKGARVAPADRSRYDQQQEQQRVQDEQDRKSQLEMDMNSPS